MVYLPIVLPDRCGPDDVVAAGHLIEALPPPSSVHQVLTTETSTVSPGSSQHVGSYLHMIGDKIDVMRVLLPSTHLHGTDCQLEAGEVERLGSEDLVSGLSCGFLFHYLVRQAWLHFWSITQNCKLLQFKFWLYHTPLNAQNASNMFPLIPRNMKKCEKEKLHRRNFREKKSFFNINVLYDIFFAATKRQFSHSHSTVGTTPSTCVVSAVQFWNQLIKVCTAKSRSECWSCLGGRGLTWCLSDCPCATVSVSPQLGAVLSSHTLHIIMARLYTDITAPLWVLNCHHQTYESQWTILDLNSLFASLEFAWFKL